MHGTVRRFLRSDKGATAIEYGLITSLLIVGIIAVVAAIGQNLTGMYQSVADAFAN